MGKIEVKGIAERNVDYDLIRISIDFQAKDKSSAAASKKVMAESEEVIGQLKRKGFDLSNISLTRDNVGLSSDWTNSEKVEYYSASREIEFICKYDMKLINDIRSIIGNMGSGVSYSTSYMLSRENEIKQELLQEAFKNSKAQAELLAAAIDQKVIGLISADKRERNIETAFLGDVLCQCLCEDVEPRTYENSDQLKASNINLSEYINTVWEIG